MNSADEKVQVISGASPNEVRDPAVRAEIKKASVWFGIACAIALVVLLVQPLLIIFAGLVFAAMLDGGVRLLGKVLKIGRGWRLTIVVLLTVAFLLGTFYLTGVQVAQQFTQLRATLEGQFDKVSGWLSSMGIMPGKSDLSSIAQQALGSVGKIGSYLGIALGALTSLFMILVLGLFIAMEPRLYDRGLQWMIPQANRAEFALTMQRMGVTMRRLLAGRLLGMALEGVLTFLILWFFGVPMALVLGIIAAILAFIPNVGAFITGVLMTAVGFSAGADTGIAALATYFVVQTFDGYVVIPMVAKKTVDLPPALTLGAQILASTLFGILGLALADPMTAMIKVAMERSSERAEEDETAVA
ncbi:AI-2E family transporter [Sphingomonas sp. GB1N7]|uniref:AI-2E family transporter n=1 Tax=Parasphingomonas caseinilytica TaxID=3096158 RepID=UPI002FC58173